MGKLIFLRLLILCVSLSQGFASLSNNGIADSLEHHVRQKRVLDFTRNANTRVQMRDFSYVVHVKRDNQIVCAGSILSADVILTAAKCFLDNTGRYFVVAGTISTRGGGTLHTVNGILRHPEYRFLQFRYNIALLSLQQPITFGQHLNQAISIYNSNNGQLPPNTSVTVSGFGYIPYEPRFPGLSCLIPERGGERWMTPLELRAIQIPTSSIQACRAQYRNDRRITDNEIICTDHPQKSCSPSEYGNPLVYQGRLVGILVWDGYHRGSDIFVNVAFTPIRDWIITHMFPQNIPRHNPRPPSPPPPNPHHHRRPEECSKVYPCNK